MQDPRKRPPLNANTSRRKVASKSRIPYHGWTRQDNVARKSPPRRQEQAQGSVARCRHDNEVAVERSELDQNDDRKMAAVDSNANGKPSHDDHVNGFVKD